MAPRPLRVALIGAGNFARKAHVPSLLALGDRLQVVAVYSRSHDSARAVAAMLPAPVEIYDDIPSLLALEDLDAVDIVLPIPQMPAAVTMALEAGKHVISEKPIAGEVVAARELLRRYRARPDLVWMVAENWRYEPAFRAAAAAVAEGAIGRPLLCDWSLQLPVMPGAPYHRTLWRRSNRFPGGFILDGGVHHVAGLRLVVGEIEAVSGMGVARRADLPPLDTAALSLRFAGGAIGTYAVTYAAAGPLGDNSLHLVGEEGSLRVNARQLLLQRGEGREESNYGPPYSVERELAAFAAAVVEGKPHYNPPEQALQDLAVVEAMLRAVETDSVQPVALFA